MKWKSQIPQGEGKPPWFLQGVGHWKMFYESHEKGADGRCVVCGNTHEFWHADEPDWKFREGCLCPRCQEHLMLQEGERE